MTTTITRCDMCKTPDAVTRWGTMLLCADCKAWCEKPPETRDTPDPTKLSEQP